MTKKRGNGEGSIYQRTDGRWVGQYLVHTAKGPKYRYLYGKTRQAVAEKLPKAMADRDSGLIFDAGKVTLGEYLDRWIADSVKSTVRTSTYERHEEIVRLHIKPGLGRVGLKKLTPAHVRGLYSEKLGSGLLAPATVRKIRSTLHKAPSQAVSDGVVPRNAADLKAPRPTPGRCVLSRRTRPERSWRPPGSLASASRRYTYWQLAPACGVVSSWAYVGTT